jgi:hypothetical protein
MSYQFQTASPQATSTVAYPAWQLHFHQGGRDAKR